MRDSGNHRRGGMKNSANEANEAKGANDAIIWRLCKKRQEHMVPLPLFDSLS